MSDGVRGYPLDIILTLHLLDEDFATYKGTVTGDTVSIDRQIFMDQGRPLYVTVRVPSGSDPLPDWVK